MLMNCTNPACENEFDRDYSWRYGVGFSHYTIIEGEYERSYSQVFNTQHCCSKDCAKIVTHDRIEAHSTIPFGEYFANIHNPTNEQSHKTCRDNVEYNQDGIMPSSALPKVCAVCEKSLSNLDVYIPHVDDSTNGKILNVVPLGACSLEHAQELAHKFIEEA